MSKKLTLNDLIITFLSVVGIFTLVRKYTSQKKNPWYVAIAILFVVLHLILLNINVAEWGDSYRILRASEYIRSFSYPDDEKRPPLYSIFLAFRPEMADQVLWGRVLMFLLSIVSYFVFDKLLVQYKFSDKQRNLALLFFTLNPIYLYWSLRLMADVPFTLLVMLALFFLNKFNEQLKIQNLVLSGLFVGLAVLTRFEGYILGFALGLDLLFKKQSFATLAKKMLVFGITCVLTILPWFIYRNPLTSSYFEEPSGRSYDFTTVWIYIASLLFNFGSAFGFLFIFKSAKTIKSFLLSNVGFMSFLIIELVLALVWPAAIPRLFTPITPLLVILLVPSIFYYFDLYKSNLTRLVPDKSMFYTTLLAIFLLCFYVFSQFYLKLQFLVLVKSVLFIVILVQLIIIFSIYIKSFNMFIVSSLLSMFIWSMATIYIHKDIFKVVQEANVYASKNLEGKIAYNDVSSVSDWHLNQKNKNDKVSGYYLNMDSKKGRSLTKLTEMQPDYLLITNEHNPTLEFDTNEVDYLEPVKEFRYTIRGTEFFTKIVKVKYDNK